MSDTFWGRRDSKQLFCLAGSPEYREVVEAGEEIPGLVSDGEPWIHQGTAYECVKGAKVMLSSQFTGRSKYLRHAYAHNEHGER